MTPIHTPLQTNIIHSVRKALDISYEEYVIADAINFICSYKKNESRRATGKYREAIAEFAGVSMPTVNRAISKLIKKGLVNQVSRQSVEITPKWQEAISNKTSHSYQNDTSEKTPTHIKMIQVENTHSYQNDISEKTPTHIKMIRVKNPTHIKLITHSYQNDMSVYINIHNIHNIICPKLPFLTNFSTSFLDDFFILVFEASTISFDTPKIYQKVAGEDSADIKKSSKSAAARDYEALFAEFWAAYPRKEKKAEAHRRYRKLAQKHRSIMAALTVYAAKVENTDAKYIKLPTTFLTDYEDYLPSEDDLLTSPKDSKILEKGGGDDVCNDDYEELEAAKNTLRLLAAAISKAYPNTQDQIKRVSGSAFELVDSGGNRIFNDKAAAWVEEMGGTWSAILELSGTHFDARSAMAWRIAKSKTA